jgi:hypothetical protein
MNQLPETPVQLLTLMANTSTQITVFSDGVIEAVQGGEIPALTVLVQLKAMETASERIRKEIRPNMLNEIDKQPDTFQYLGNKITKAEHGTKYEFENCNHPGWNDLTKIINNAIEQRKEIEATLKTLKAPTTLVFDDEIVTVNPPIKKSTSGINISIK